MSLLKLKLLRDFAGADAGDIVKVVSQTETLYIFIDDFFQKVGVPKRRQGEWFELHNELPSEFTPNTGTN